LRVFQVTTHRNRCLSRDVENDRSRELLGPEESDASLLQISRHDDVIGDETRPQVLPVRSGIATEGLMGIAEKIYEVVRDLPEFEAAEILGLAEHVKARTAMVVPAR